MRVDRSQSEWVDSQHIRYRKCDFTEHIPLGRRSNESMAEYGQFCKSVLQ